MSSGIYTITNIDGTVYVGSAVNIKQRWIDHRKRLRGGNHDNIHLQRAWNRDGESAFTFCVLEEVEDINNLIEREQYWIDNTPRLYNICPTAGNCLGRVVSEEGRRNISEGRKGIPSVKTPEHLAKIAAALKGRRPSQATLDASAAKIRGVPLTDEHRAKVGAALRGKKRPPRSPEHIAKLKAAAQARMSDPERRAALSRTMKERGIAPSHEAQIAGSKVANSKPRVMTPELREKYAANRRGKPMSEESRKRISDGGKARWAERRGKVEE